MWGVSDTDEMSSHGIVVVVQVSKGAREATPYAATMAMEKCLEETIRLYGLKRAHVVVKGVGAGRDNALRAIVAAGVEIDSILDETPSTI